MGIGLAFVYSIVHCFMRAGRQPMQRFARG
jgi:hypothetical protein